MYVYTRPIASKHFNYKHVLRDFNIDDFKSMPPYCTCARFPFIYNPTVHVITGDLKIINNTSLREVIVKGPKYRESKSINWKHNFKILMDSSRIMPDTGKNVKRRTLDTLYEWVKSVRLLIQIII